jgi:hypothetical protein
MLVGCNKTSNDNGNHTGDQESAATPKPSLPPYPKGTAFFENAGVSLLPGDGWDHLNGGEFTKDTTICLPMLKGLGITNESVIQVLKREGDEGPDKAADIMKQNFESNPNTVKGTFKQEHFRSAHNVAGYYISYDYGTKSILHTDKRRAHVYLFQNANRNCIVINYITLIDKDSVPVHNMICNTLRLN